MNGDEKTEYKNSRINVLAAAAFVIVILCLVAVVILTVKDEFAKSIFTLVLGRFLGYVDSIYAFEFGTTRGSKEKDDVITNLAASSPIAPSNVTASAIETSRRAKQPAVTPGPPTPDGVIPAAEVVDQPPKGEVK